MGKALDIVARIEERLLQIPLDSDGFLENVSDFVDQSFELLKVEEFRQTPSPRFLNFDIDEETLEIFRSEASELIGNIVENIRVLENDPNDREALWEIRRNAHTFKGAAGIVGQRDASALAHRVEDLLDQIVESTATVQFDRFLSCHLRLNAWKHFRRATTSMTKPGRSMRLYREFDRVIAWHAGIRNGDGSSTSPAQRQHQNSSGPKLEAAKAAPAHIVRVSLDRLDHLIKLSQDLAANRNTFDVQFAELIRNGSGSSR